MSTSVNEVKLMMNSFMSGKATKVSVGDDLGFKAVWESQSAETGTEELGQKAENLSQKTSSTTKMNHPAKDSLKAKEPQVQDTVRKEGEPLTEENLEEAMQVLNTAAGTFFTQVAQELGLTEEELGSLMEELGMDKLDLLQPEQLTELVLAAGGEQDVMSLLTNENLYQSLQDLQSQLTDVMNQVSQETQLTVPELNTVLEQAVQQIQPNEEPVVVVETEAVSVSVSDEQKSQESASTEDASQQSVKATAVDKTAEQTVVEKPETKTSQQHSENNADKSNNFFQNFAERLEQVVEGKAAPYVSGQDISMESIMKQIVDYMKVQVKPDMSSIEMQLQPENLGTLHIQLSTKQGAVTAQFITQNDAVKAALEGQMIQLKESFAEQGVKVESIEVMVQTQEFNRSLDQGKGHEQNAPEKKNKVRKLNLSMLEGIEEELTEEDQITVEMMTANGNTLNYTV